MVIRTARGRAGRPGPARPARHPVFHDLVPQPRLHADRGLHGGAGHVGQALPRQVEGRARPSFGADPLPVARRRPVSRRASTGSTDRVTESWAARRRPRPAGAAPRVPRRRPPGPSPRRSAPWPGLPRVWPSLDDRDPAEDLAGTEELQDDVLVHAGVPDDPYVTGLERRVALVEDVLPGSTRFLAGRRRQRLELSPRKAGEDGTGLQKVDDSLERGRDIGGQNGTRR